MAGKQNWIAGGELKSNDGSPQEFKQIILDILQEGETVTKCVSKPIIFAFVKTSHMPHRPNSAGSTGL